MKLIPLTQGYYATVDDKDFLYLLNWKWRVQINKDGCLYALRWTTKNEHGNNERCRIYMHNVIAERMGLKNSPDHKDRNGLNNRRNNLREATKTQQVINRKRFKNSKAKYIGVQCIGNKFEVQIRHKGKAYIGKFESEEMAARTYDYYAIKFHGEFAILNFPESRDLYKF